MATTKTKKRGKEESATETKAVETNATQEGVENETPQLPEDVAREVEEHKGTQVSNDPVEPTGTPKPEERPTAFDRETELAVDSAFEFIPFEQVYRRDNVRTTASLRLEEMVSSLTLRGFKKNHPIVVSQKPDGRFLVLCGNRRTEGLEVLQTRDEEAFTRALPDGMIPAIVHRDLTEEEEILIRIDHSADEDRVPLDEWGQFLAVKQLVRVGYDSQANIAAKLGQYDKDGQPKRSWVQQRVNLARMPKFVQDEMEKYCMGGKEASHLRWTHMAGLYKTFLAAFNAGDRTGGAKLREEFDAIINPTVDPDTGNKPSPMSAAAVEKHAQVVASRILFRTLMKVAGKPTDQTPEGEAYIADWADIEGEAIQAETAMHQLTRIAEHLGNEKFNELIDSLPAEEAVATPQVDAAEATDTK